MHLPFAPTLGLALVASPTSAVAAQLEFSPPKPIDTTGYSQDVELADLDGDQDLDLITLDTVPGEAVSLFLNDGSGQFGPPTQYALSSWADSVAVGDVDNDGDGDLVVMIASFPTQAGVTPSQMATLLNNGDGTFASPLYIPAGNETTDIDLGDIDGDGNLDVALSNWAGDLLTLHFGDGHGHFGPAVGYPAPGRCFSVEMADLDGDSDLDLAMTNFGGANVSGPGEVWVFTNDGAGVLSTPAIYTSGAGCWYVDVADMDLDGDLDLVTTNRNSDTLSVLGNAGDGTFGPESPTLIAGLYPRGTSVGDFDGDGDPDVAVINNGMTQLRLFENDGEGGLTAAGTNTAGSGQLASASGDIDGDGDLDLVVARPSLVAAFLGKTPQLDPLLIVVNHMVGGGVATIELRNGTPAALLILALGLQGIGPDEFLPGLNTSIALTAPFLLGTGIADSSGEFDWSFPLDPSLAGLDLWLQAVEPGASSPVVATTIH